MNTPSDSSYVALPHRPDLIIKLDTPKGRGVFSKYLIPAKTIIDVCPVLVLGFEENREHIEHTSLYHYTYNWPIVDCNGSRRIAQAVTFGLGSMFNHSTQAQNVVWKRDVDHLTITYWTSRDILPGEELCISYGAHLTFNDADSPIAPSIEEEIEQLNRIQLD